MDPRAFSLTLHLTSQTKSSLTRVGNPHSPIYGHSIAPTLLTWNFDQLIHATYPEAKNHPPHVLFFLGPFIFTIVYFFILLPATEDLLFIRHLLHVNIWCSGFMANCNSFKFFSPCPSIDGVNHLIDLLRDPHFSCLLRTILSFLTPIYHVRTPVLPSLSRRSHLRSDATFSRGDKTRLAVASFYGGQRSYHSRHYIFARRRWQAQGANQ